MSSAVAGWFRLQMSLSHKQLADTFVHLAKVEDGVERDQESVLC